MNPSDGMTAHDWLGAHAGEECCDIVTEGRSSGRPHEVELWFGVMDGAMYLLSGNGPGADWYLNLRENPQVVVRLGGAERVGRAELVIDPEERRRCGDLMGAKYVWEGDPDIGLTYQAWCYDVPALVIEF